MSFISSFDIISVVVCVVESEGLPEARIFFLCIRESAAVAVAVNPNGTKILLANGLVIFLIKCNPVFSNGPRSLPGNPLDFIILDKRVFDSLTSVDDLLAKALRRFATCVLVDNNLCG